MATRSVLVLDFDGVVCDSRAECLVVAYNAYCRLTGRFREVNAPAEIEPEVWALLVRNRYLVRPADEYFVLVESSLEPGVVQLTQDAFDERKRGCAAAMRSFRPLFFEVRHEVMRDRPKQWLAWHHMYSEFADFWEEERPADGAYLVTTKDALSIDRLLTHYEIEIPRRKRWTAERIGGSKAAALGEIVRSEGIEPHDAVFVDDHVGHLKDVAAVGFRCCLASWGFCDPTAVEEAVAAGIRPIHNLGEALRGLSEAW